MLKQCSRFRPVRTGLLAASILVTAAFAGPVALAVAAEPAMEAAVVDCLLPGQTRKLGGKFLALAPRVTVQTSPADCELRGGQLAALDRPERSVVAAERQPSSRDVR